MSDDLDRLLSIIAERMVMCVRGEDLELLQSLITAYQGGIDPRAYVGAGLELFGVGVMPSYMVCKEGQS